MAIHRRSITRTTIHWCSRDDEDGDGNQEENGSRDTTGSSGEPSDVTPARQRWSTPNTNGSQYVFGAEDDLRLHVLFRPNVGWPEQAFLLRKYLATVESRRGKVGWRVKRNGECGDRRLDGNSDSSISGGSS